MPDLREILSSAAGTLAGSLGGLVGDTVSAEVADLQGGPPANFSAALAEGGVAIQLTAAGPATGGMVLWAPESAAKLVAGALAQEEAAPEELTDLHVSALGELGRVGAEALSAAIGGAMPGSQVSPGEVQRADAAAAAGLVGGLGAEINQATINLNLKGGALALQLFIQGELAAAISTATAESSAAPVAEAAAADGFQPGLGEQGAADSGPAEVKPVGLSEAGGGQVLDISTGLELLGDVNVKITVELGRTNKYVREVLNMAPGSIIELDKLEGEPVDVYVNEMLFARGEVVTIDENFAVRITEIMSKEQRASALQQIAK